MIECVERDEVVPICPHCNGSLKEVWCKRLSGVFGRRYLYFCPLCRKVLGVSHRKGFWMG